MIVTGPSGEMPGAQRYSPRLQRLDPAIGDDDRRGLRRRGGWRQQGEQQSERLPGDGAGPVAAPDVGRASDRHHESYPMLTADPARSRRVGRKR